jgi:predicted nucleic acid-binding protein
LPAYLDTSAFLKLVRSEPESQALRDELRHAGAELISSVLLSVEGRRAARRYGKLASIRADAALTTVTLLALDQPTIEIASDLEPPELRSLDALHLATILSLGDDIERVYCYDSRLTGAARSLGIEVAEPA